MKRIKIVKNRVAALCLSMFLALGLIAPAFSITAKAEAMEVMNGACTVADMIFSYCASGGVAITNETVINDVYGVLGSSFGTLQTFVDNGLLTYSNGQYVDTGLSTNIQSEINNISSIDIGALFNQTVEQNPAGVELTGAGSLAGIAGSVATTGVLPVVAGVAVSGYCGFQIGTIIANMLGLYGENIGKCVPLDIKEVYLNQIANGNSCAIAYYHGPSYDYTYMVIGSGYTVCYSASGRKYVGLVDISGNLRNYKRVEARRDGYNNITYSENVQQSFFGLLDEYYVGSNATNYFSSKKEFDNAVLNWRNGISTPEPNYSPDTVGISGNLYGEYDSNSHKYSVPDMVQNVDPEINSINPTGMSENDWKNYANSANDNFINGVPENNSQIFNYIINKIKIDSPTPGAQPNPEPDPDPGTVPAPTPNPDPDYDVDQPDTNTQETETPETDPNLNPPDFVLPNLMEKFPFCIPNDIATIFGKFRNQTRQAPYISWRFNPPGTPIDYTFNLNLSEFEEVAALLRTLELIAFVVGLAYATRYLIGSS